MKKISLFLCGFILFLFSSAFAHPPSDITITFDPNTKILKALIAHSVSNPRTHFILKVDIGLNGREIIEQTISRQDNAEGQSVSFYIPDASVGDTLSVEGYCSISGKLKKQIQVVAP